MLTLKLEARKIEGKIFFENDTIDVTFNIPIKFFTQELNYEKLQNKVKYYDSSGEIIILKPEYAKEIQFKYENKNVRMLSRSNSIGVGNIFKKGAKIFLKLESDGKLKLFNYYQTQFSPGMYNDPTGSMSGGTIISVENYILQKGDGELKRLKGLTFKKDMAEYFSDCPALVAKIESKDFRKRDMNIIVRFYNSYCK